MTGLLENEPFIIRQLLSLSAEVGNFQVAEARENWYDCPIPMLRVNINTDSGYIEKRYEYNDLDYPVLGTTIPLKNQTL